ncbi:unnamed protein product [Cyprideis torosa]|uniref:Large ribosomal subunit protein mL62 n=1 Tax=Cyprideis torosa TaxID=163714 RepID=A0A7R8ZKD1_9CRUS|nr:unnamed protein product [Cyprideis torosa]CAG0879972.1 unnamed protein product [Cyprideis torosa]
MTVERFLCYQSPYNVEQLYSKPSQAQFADPPIPKAKEPGKFNGHIPMKRLEISYSLSSGPGGQFVQKRNTKVDLRFKIDQADWLSYDTRLKLVEQNKTKISKEGYFVVRSDKTRHGHLNVADCLDKLRELITQAEKGPKEISEECVERQRRLKERANRKRLEEKRYKSALRRMGTMQ